jgi:hypothetical protein
MFAVLDPLPPILGERHDDVGDGQLLKIGFRDVVQALDRPVSSLTWVDRT